MKHPVFAFEYGWYLCDRIPGVVEIRIDNVLGCDKTDP